MNLIMNNHASCKRTFVWIYLVVLKEIQTNQDARERHKPKVILSTQKNTCKLITSKHQVPHIYNSHEKNNIRGYWQYIELEICFYIHTIIYFLGTFWIFIHQLQNLQCSWFLKGLSQPCMNPCMSGKLIDVDLRMDTNRHMLKMFDSSKCLIKNY